LSWGLAKLGKRYSLQMGDPVVWAIGKVKRTVVLGV